MPFTQCSIALETAHPLVLQFVRTPDTPWKLHRMWRHTKKRPDDGSTTFIRELVVNSQSRLMPLFSSHQARHEYSRALEKILQAGLGRDSSLDSVSQQNLTEAVLSNGLFPVTMVVLDGKDVAAGVSINLTINPNDGAFWGDTVLSVDHEPPML